MRENNDERDLGKGVHDCVHLKLKILSRESSSVCDAWAWVQVSTQGCAGVKCWVYKCQVLSAVFTSGCLAG